MQTSAPATVLVADEDVTIRAALRKVVDQALPGARLIESADDGSLRVAALEHPDADLVLLSLALPGSRGFATLAWLRGRFARMAVLVVSAGENSAVMRRAMAFGAAACLPKSAPREQFLAAIRAAIDRGGRQPDAGRTEFPASPE